MPNSNKYFSNGFVTVVSILLQKSVQWNLSCCMPKHPVLHSEGAAEVLGCLSLVCRGGRQQQWLCLVSHWGIVHCCTSLWTKKWQQRSLLWQIKSPADKLWVQGEKVTSDQIIANCSGSATLSWTAAELMYKTRACIWRYFCFCFLCPGEADLAQLSGCHHPADWPQEHLGGPWKLGCRLSWSLLIPWPSHAEILEEKEPTGGSGSSGTLHFLYVSRGCDSGEVRAGSLLPAAAQGGKKTEKAPIWSPL